MGQGVELEFDVSVTDHFGAVGFRPEFGARELRRLIRSELETELAREMLSGRIGDGDKVRVVWSPEAQKIVFETFTKGAGEDSQADQAGVPDGAAEKSAPSSMAGADAPQGAADEKTAD